MSQSTEAVIRALLEGLPDAIVGARRDGTIVLVNGLAEELFGYPEAELLGKPISMLWPERVRERYERNTALYFQLEHPLRFSARAYGLRRDGTEFVGEMSWGIVETAAGTDSAYIGDQPRIAGQAAELGRRASSAARASC